MTVLGGDAGRLRLEAEDPALAWSLRVAAHTAILADMEANARRPR